MSAADERINHLIQAAKAEAAEADRSAKLAAARAAQSPVRNGFAISPNAAANQSLATAGTQRYIYDVSDAEKDALAMAQAAMEAVKQAAVEEVTRAAAMVEAAQRAVAEEKEKRIQHTQAMAVRRLCKQTLSRAWNAWCEDVEEKRRTTRLLRAGAARLLRPARAACFGHWRRDWEAAARDHAAKEWEMAAQGAIDTIYADAMAKVAAAEAAAREQAELARAAMAAAEAAKAEAEELRAQAIADAEAAKNATAQVRAKATRTPSLLSPLSRKSKSK